MGSIEFIATNAKARLLARTDISTRWSDANVVIVGADAPAWPNTEYAARLMVGAGSPGADTMIRGTLSIEVGHRSALDNSPDYEVAQRNCLAAAGEVHRALVRSRLSAAIEEGLQLRSTGRVRDVSREQGGGVGWGVAVTLEYSWGVDWGDSFVPLGDDGTGIDDGSEA